MSAAFEWDEDGDVVATVTLKGVKMADMHLARILVAAPEMYEALKKIEYLDLAIYDEGSGAAGRIARDALAKAEGRNE